MISALREEKLKWEPLTNLSTKVNACPYHIEVEAGWSSKKKKKILN